MAEATEYLKLIKPAKGEKYDVEAVTNGNSDKVDAAVKALVDKYPKGTIYYKEINANSGSLVGPITVDSTTAINLIAGRNYKLIYQAASNSGQASNALAISCKKGAAGNTDPAEGNVIGYSITHWTAPAASSGKTLIYEYSYTAATTESVAFKIIVQRVVGTGDVIFSSRCVTVVDMGMNT